MSRLQELYSMRDQLNAAIAREEAALLRMARLRDAVHELLQEKHSVDTMAVLEAVAAEYAVPVHELVGRCREQVAVAPRQVAAAVLRQVGLSYPQIGRVLGRDHTTVMSSCSRATTHPDLAAAVGRVMAKLAAEHPTVRLAAVS